jgi:hypothetical protein
MSDLTGVDYPVGIIKGIIHELLPTEREVIEEAYQAGIKSAVSVISGDAIHVTLPSDYFTTKFNDNEHTKS